MVDVAAIGLRAATYAASLLAAGLAMFVVLFGQQLQRSSRHIRSAVLPSAAIALVLLALHALVEPVRLTGNWSGLLDWSLHVLLFTSDFGTTISIRALGLIAIAASMRIEGSRGAVFATIGAPLVAASFAFVGHTADDPQRWLLAVLLLVHLLAVAFWFGSLWPLSAITRLETAEIAADLIGRFSQAALCVVPLVLLAGLAMSGLLLHGLSGLRTAYGIALIAKFGGFSVLMVFASLNKWRLAPGVALGKRTSASAFRRSVLTEWVVILAVVTVTAVMTAQFSPDH